MPEEIFYFKDSKFYLLLVKIICGHKFISSNANQMDQPIMANPRGVVQQALKQM